MIELNRSNELRNIPKSEKFLKLVLDHKLMILKVIGNHTLDRK